MDKCDASTAKPMGLCIDQGTVVNNKLESTYGGIVVVYATGGMVASAIEKGDLGITINKTHTKMTVDISNQFQLQTFIEWAKEEKASVFQTHLFVYKDSVRIIENPNEVIKKKSRRFLAVCKESDGSISHYIINHPNASSLYQSVKMTMDYLKDVENVTQIMFMINLDTGCQNFYNVYRPNGDVYNDHYFKGESNFTVNQAANLLTYYYE